MWTELDLQNQITLLGPCWLTKLLTCKAKQKNLELTFVFHRKLSIAEWKKVSDYVVLKTIKVEYLMSLSFVVLLVNAFVHDIFPRFMHFMRTWKTKGVKRHITKDKPIFQTTLFQNLHFSRFDLTWIWPQSLTKFDFSTSVVDLIKLNLTSANWILPQ